MDVRRILVVGAGTMGLQIALQAARHGIDVVLHDSDPATLEQAPARLHRYGGPLVGYGLLTDPELDALVAGISCVSDLTEAVEEVDVVSESVPEDPAVKQALFARLHELCPPRTLFTTNTSMLLPSQIAPAVGRPERFAAWHFHNPVWACPVVDVMPHPGTAPETIETLTALSARIGQVPIQLRQESPGYVFNAMYSAINRAALTLAANGIASVEDIDRAWMGVMRMPVGPFGMLDQVGLGTVWQITEHWARALEDPQGQANADFLRGYLDDGRNGKEGGAGFYNYPHPAFETENFLLAP